MIFLKNISCQVIRVACLDMEDAKAIKEIKENIHIPIVADIHLYNPQFFNISFATFISAIGLSDKDTLIVSPIPSLKSTPKPILDLIVPEKAVPASVIPICNG